MSGDINDHSDLLQSLRRVPATPIHVKGGGMAFTLITKEVIRSLHREDMRNPGKREWFWTEHVIDEDSHKELHLSEDYCFCRRARELGFNIIMDPSVMVGHVDEKIATMRDWLSAAGVEFSEV